MRQSCFLLFRPKPVVAAWAARLPRSEDTPAGSPAGGALAVQATLMQIMSILHHGTDHQEAIFTRVRAALKRCGQAALLGADAPLQALAALRDSAANPSANVGWVSGGSGDSNAETVAAVKALLNLTVAATAGVGPLDAGVGTSFSAVEFLCRMLEPGNRTVGIDGALSLHSCAVRYVALLCSLGTSEAFCDALAANGAVDSLAAMLVSRIEVGIEYPSFSPIFARLPPKRKYRT